ncbi:FKBP-type peptidyl-prolyl cis-trans isomerase [Aliidiomarina quisquiliarum]|uniref:FKBP-type peptidyl-prolyl cis-trans isomerase n=1 Tax=Aliidiomarina quisquiliarum TaxID=2938947 RepID=UPI00208E5C5A|nr:FKBP-type peptidyl-prolyl cis-trans isomerase [Aliidiomarina quisquiliarum]MCO4321150.1 FKBP-type peptidyl-prolyl cis-trans isomerase [Aliidiomarina quisquiliarum]
MKIVAKTALASVVALALAGCGGAEVKTQVDLETDSHRHAYALGTVLGDEVKSNLEHLASTGITLDNQVVLAALADALNGETQLSEDQVQEAVMELVELSTSLAEAESALAGQRNLEEGLAYQRENAAREGVVVTESGLQYEILVAGEGASPVAEDTVTVHYEGKLIDDTVFDSSYERGEPIAFPLNRVIVGWSEGVQLMNVGSKYRFVIPAELAYGEQQRPGSPIPPNATLIFEVELLEIEAAE